MGRRKVTVDNLNVVLQQILNQYEEILWENIDEAADKIAKKTRTALRNASTQFDGSGHWGKQKYSSGWNVKKVPQLWYNAYIVHNSHKPTETHLLEYGHDLVKGKRVPLPNPLKGTFINTKDRAEAYPHISPIAAEVPDQMETEVVNVIHRCS